MTAGLLLDGLLLLVVAFYVPIGAWRGGISEAFLGGAILLGAATADAWAPAWGDELAELSGSGAATCRFLVAVVLLALVGGGLGYGAGALANRRPATLESRAAGGALGLVNALLILSFLVSFLTTFFNEGRAIKTVEAAWFAEALVERQGWLLILACGLATCLVVASRVVARFDDDLVEREAGWERTAAVGARRRLAVAPPADPDGGKVDPAASLAQTAAVAHRPEIPLRKLTRPVVPPVLAPPAEPSGAAASSQSGNGGGEPGHIPRLLYDGSLPREGSVVVESWLRRASELDAAAPDPASDRETGERTDFPFTDAALRNLLDPAQDRGQAALPRVNPLAGLLPPVEATSAPDPAAQSGSGSALDPVRRCDICGASAATGSAECPFCGATL
jgi:hypothetical protein